MIHRFNGVEKILVIKLRQIGDVLLTLPVFSALREHFKEAHIAVLVNSGTDELLNNNPYINEVIIFDRGLKNRVFLSRFFHELRFLRHIRAKGFDMVVDLTNVDRSAILSFASGAKYRLADNSPQKGIQWKRHAYTHRASKKYEHHSVLKNLDVIREFGITTDTVTLELPVHKKDREVVREMFRSHNINEQDKIIHVHPVSRLLFKCWKDEYMAEVIHWAVCRNIKVVITSSPEIREFEKVKKIISLVHALNGPMSQQDETATSQNLLDLSGRTTIGELAAVSEASSLFFGVDSAPMHIAASVGTQVIALFGRAESRWRPWGEGHRVLTGNLERKNGKADENFVRDNLLRVKPQEVIQELEKRLCVSSSA
jgi:heptosyltransferase-3